MPIQISGQISISDITSEIPTLIGNVSLYTLSTANININSPSRPDGSAPHAMSEFYGYDHSYNPGTLWVGSDPARTDRGQWDLLCGYPLYITYLLNTPSPLIGTNVRNSDGSALSLLPAYIAFSGKNVAELDGGGNIAKFHSCVNIGDPFDPGSGIGLTPAPGEGDDPEDPFNIPR
jgi:hypothetical protein